MSDPGSIEECVAIQATPDILGPDGLIAQTMPAYEHRPQQIEMATEVAAAFNAGGPLLVEAGTGVGKSFAYLVPAIERVLHHGGRVVISTHTIALQEQLIHKDIPFLQKIYPQEFRAVLVKGRANYLGLRRLQRASEQHKLLFDADGQVAELHRIEDWAYDTQDGSLSDLPFTPHPTVWDRARSDSDDCLGRKCPYYDNCFYQRARRRAASAQILVVNHAMLFSDLAVRQQGASILPDYEYVVLDEAHTVERVAGDHLGVSISETTIRFLLNRLFNPRTGRGILASPKWREVAPEVERVQAGADGYFDDLFAWFREQPGWNGRLRSPAPVPNDLTGMLGELAARLRDLREDEDDEEDRMELESAMGQCTSAALSVKAWHDQADSGWVYWLDARSGPRRRVSLGACPVDVGPLLQSLLFDRLRSAVLTSATLTTAGNEPFKFIKNRLGLDGARTTALGSPFDYRNQLRVYVEADMPDPQSPSFAPRATQAVLQYLERTDGHAFVLFTSYGMMQRFAEVLQDDLRERNMTLLVQGQGKPRTQMLTEFRNTPRSVLFGTDTFWAGVDVPGDALQNVIIVKLPFSVPTQPMIEARLERIKEQGGQPFMEFQVPEAVLKFKQGVGRLIRTAEDRGIIVILDPRVVSKPYGKRFLKALPETEVEIVTRAPTP